ncbi:hypothetical protein YC2023_037669 [Brassica napus]|uniref:Uncharacterized protein n=1 Tax=Brassica cretica TaxID=69181 RepID=A0ABQ7CFX5_BRACR|nr:hypothetical protein DY000_02001905 [Brassica cretica]
MWFLWSSDEVSLVQGSVGEVLPRCLRLSGVVLFVPIDFSVVMDLGFVESKSDVEA